ncbi:hypothetical protein [Rhodoferax sp.]|uniref:hypothetical protein n=1 Tax=Rhodoferax sp. TaxID=50421 RepID=UPI002ACD2004|nr:hypothetical protein [Rhodoferax sp.]MDZ7919485.1 hypothetical protein [Rhodoferax sp.]
MLRASGRTAASGLAAPLMLAQSWDVKQKDLGGTKVSEKFDGVRGATGTVTDC